MPEHTTITTNAIPDDEPTVGGVDLVTPLEAEVAGDEITVMHVDDEPSFGELVQLYLEQVSDRFTVVTERCAADGLDRLAEDSIDCIVSDYDMPGMDGLQFLDAVRCDDPTVPFVLFTGKGSEEIASRAIANGVTEYMQKGGGTDQYDLLANRIENAVEQARTKQNLWTTLTWYQRLVEQNLAGIYLVQRGRFVYVNRKLADIFQYAQSELAGESPMTIVAESDRDLVETNIRRRERGEVDSVQYTFTGRRKDGERLEIEAHGGSIEFQGEPAIMGLLLPTGSPAP